MERLDGDLELLGELVELFLADCPRLLDDIRTAIEAGDAEQLMRAAHTLKGSVSNFCAPLAAEAAQKLEAQGRSRDLSISRESFVRLESVMERFTTELGQLTQGSVAVS
jgi:HPt (histidine-containing phosphotransfer) domain-containing protein